MTQAAQMAQPMPAEQRQYLLSQKIQAQIRRGARVESQDYQSAVLVYGKPVNHVLHAILSIFLLGLWLIPWITIAVLGGERREMVTVDPWGRIATSKL